MTNLKREIPNYETDLIALIDISRAFRTTMNQGARLRVLEYIVRKQIGDEYRIVKP